jgi:hypothetical protein
MVYEEERRTLTEKFREYLYLLALKKFVTKFIQINFGLVILWVNMISRGVDCLNRKALSSIQSQGRTTMYY